MTEYLITSTKFYNEFRNGPTFALNTGEFTNALTGAVGELVQVVQEFEITTEVFASDFGGVDYENLSTETRFILNSSWFDEGISVGATVDVSWNNGVETGTETVTALNGNNGGTLVMTRTSAKLIALPSQTRADFEFHVSSVPDKLMYKYSLNQNSSNSNDYTSPYDQNEQAYTETITGSLTPLIPVGNFSGWDLGTVSARTIATSGYTHSYEVVHTFRIPFYTSVQVGNVQQTPTLPPDDLIGTNSLKYGFGIFLAETNNDYNREYEYAGQTGIVKYFDLAINSLATNYDIQNITYSNSTGTDTLETTVQTNVSLEVKKSSGNFAAGQKIILNHSKLPTSSEYSNKTDSFDDVWLFESLEETVNGGASSGTIITSFFSNLNADNTIIDVFFSIQYTSDQQLLIDDTHSFLLSIIVADETLGVYDTDKVNRKIDSRAYSRDADVQGLVQNNNVRFYVSGDEIGPIAAIPTDFKGWDGDFVGVVFNFETKAEDGAILTDLNFKLIARNAIIGTSFTLKEIPYSLSTPTLTDPDLTIYPYQLEFIDQQAAYNITPTETFNRLFLQSITPVSGTSFQDWVGRFAFKVQWRDWIANAAVPAVFYDDTLPNDNLNFKTSNYSEIENYEIFAALDLTIANDIGADTVYRVLSDKSIILDFDDDGGTGFVGTITYIDSNGDPTNEIYTNEPVTIIIEFAHSLGLLPDAFGEIVIEADGSIVQEWRLSTNKDWTNNASLLAPSGATNFVEVIDAVNLYTLKCNTNNLNLVEGITYNIYGILGKT